MFKFLCVAVLLLVFSLVKQFFVCVLKQFFVCVLKQFFVQVGSWKVSLFNNIISLFFDFFTGHSELVFKFLCVAVLLLLVFRW